MTVHSVAYADKDTAEQKSRSLLSPEAEQWLHDTTELDYLTHIVFRMYENKR